jgi:hypothetical protein
MWQNFSLSLLGPALRCSRISVCVTPTPSLDTSGITAECGATPNCERDSLKREPGVNPRPRGPARLHQCAERATNSRSLSFPPEGSGSPSQSSSASKSY